MNAHAILDLVLLAVLMVGLGCTIDFEQFKQKFKQPLGISIGLFSQFVAMPAISFGLAKWLLADKPLLQIALVLVGCSPGGALSNILSWLVGADLPLSIAMTTASSIAAVGMLPLNIFLYLQLTRLGDEVKISYVDTVTSVGAVVLGTFAGVWVRSRSIAWAVRLGKVGALAGVLLVLLSFVANSRSTTPTWGQAGTTYAACLLATAAGLTIGLALALGVGLPRPSCVAVSIETSIQNKVVALAIIGVTFRTQAERDAASAVPLVYAFFATALNVVWAVAAWRLGFTSYDRNLGVCELLRSAKNSLEESVAEGEGKVDANGCSEQQVRPGSKISEAHVSECMNQSTTEAKAVAQKEIEMLERA
jgi:predicted Na+-dependent transporter